MNFLSDWKKNTEYFDLLQLMARLSNLFSDNSVPYLHYRVTENLFCKYYNATNLSRSDTAYDAKTDNFGVGIKTFMLPHESSIEKIAEFNSISSFLKEFEKEDLAFQLATARNDRLKFSQRLYSIENGCYHIIGRVNDGLILFNSPYNTINTKKIHSVKDTGKALQFEDDKDFYSYNYSKSTLYKRFIIPKQNQERKEIEVSIIQDPYELLRELLNTKSYEGKSNDITTIHTAIHSQIRRYKQLLHGADYVILPLFSPKQNIVPEKSGLNQWNAAGRPRNPNEVYIPVPKKIHKNFPSFFPDREVDFILNLPNGKAIPAKICQDGGKALMSNPNKLLGQWLLRDVLQLKEGELLTMETLNRMGFDSVIIYKDSIHNFRIDVCRTTSYSDKLFNGEYVKD